MDSYTPPFEITESMVSLISSISEKIGRISEHKDLQNKPHLRRNNKIKSVHSSLRIEANSLSLDEVKDVLNGRAVIGKAKEIQEVKNAFAAYDLLPSIDPYRQAELKQIHGVMTNCLVDRPGEFRAGEEGVFDGDRCIFMAPPARLVPGLMEQLFAWMKKNKDSLHPLILSSVFHYEFVFIHPFTDGNGRMARLWHTSLLMKWKPIFEYLPIESQIEKFQDGYYQAISASHAAGNSTLFVEFMLEQIDAVLNELLKAASTGDEDESLYEKRLLTLMEPGMPYTATELLALLGLRSKETLRKNYLNPAIAHGTVRMTIPDAPRSKNQRYVRDIIFM